MIVAVWALTALEWPFSVHSAQLEVPHEAARSLAGLHSTLSLKFGPILKVRAFLESAGQALQLWIYDLHGLEAV